MVGCGLDEEELELLESRKTCSNDACRGKGDMGCGEALCGGQESRGSWSRAGGGAAASQVSASEICDKCKLNSAEATVKQNIRLCTGCLERVVLQKVKFGTKSKGLLVAGDQVLLALSGGPSSVALLHCLLHLQNPNPTRLERGQIAFTLSVVHVWEATDPASEAAERDRLLAALAATGYTGPLYSLHLHDIYNEQLSFHPSPSPPPAAAAASATSTTTTTTSSSSNGTSLPAPNLDPDATPSSPGSSSSSTSTASPAMYTASSSSSSTHHLEQRLQQLLSSVTDTTGREDVTHHLRDRLLHSAAAAVGCNKLLKGDTATAIAIKVISDAAKGRGYSLAANIQLLDARSALLMPQLAAAAAAAAGAAASPAVAAGVKPAATDGAAAAGAEGAAAGATAAVGDASPMQQQDDPAGSRSTAPTPPPVLLQPLREVSLQEVQELCRLKGFLPAPGKGGSLGSSQLSSRGDRGTSINALAADFINTMTSRLPASVFTILRTASHLEAFDFNDATIPAAAAAAGGARAAAGAAGGSGAGTGSATTAGEAAAGGGARLNGNAAEEGPKSGAAGVRRREGHWCKVCWAPLPQIGNEAAAGVATVRGDDRAVAGAASFELCYSCQRQVLGSFEQAAAGVSADDGEHLMSGDAAARVMKERQLEALLP